MESFELNEFPEPHHLVTHTADADSHRLALSSHRSGFAMVTDDGIARLPFRRPN